MNTILDILSKLIDISFCLMPIGILLGVIFAFHSRHQETAESKKRWKVRAWLSLALPFVFFAVVATIDVAFSIFTGLK